MKNIALFATILVLFTALMLLCAPSPSRAGMLTFTFDDGLASVHTHALPVLREHGMTATVGVIASQVNSGDPAYMNVKQLQELQQNGWEIASHGMTHQRPADIPLYYSDELVTGWAPVDGAEHIYQVTYKYNNISVLLENDVELEEVETFSEMQRKPGTYYHNSIITQLYIHPYSEKTPDQLEIRAGSYQRELEYSHNELKDLGFNVTDYITPYNYWTDAMEKLSRTYYECVASASTNTHTNYDDASFDKYRLTRFIIHSDTPAEQIIKMLEEDAVNKNGWVILCLHGVEDKVGYEPWAAEKLARVAEWANQHGVNVVNLREGWKILNDLRNKEKASEVKPAGESQAAPTATPAQSSPAKAKKPAAGK